MKPLILYKQNGTNDTQTLLNIVRYLYTQGYDIRADTIIERNFPSSVDQLPTLLLPQNQVLKGLKNINSYYENLTKISDLANKANNFDKLNPDYRITLPHTHRNLRFS